MTDKFIDHMTRYNTEKVVYDMLYDKVFPKFKKLLLLWLLALPWDVTTTSQNHQEPIWNEKKVNEKQKDLSSYPDIVINWQKVPYNTLGEPMDDDSSMVMD